MSLFEWVEVVFRALFIEMDKRRRVRSDELDQLGARAFEPRRCLRGIETAVGEDIEGLGDQRGVVVVFG